LAGPATAFPGAKKARAYSSQLGFSLDCNDYGINQNRDLAGVHRRSMIDELHFALSPVLLGRGEAMFEGLDLPVLGYSVMESTATDLATHVVLGR
jgi:hypothetical protein